MYYPYSENKGADQLRGHHEADLHLQKSGFLITRLKLHIRIVSLIIFAIFLAVREAVSRQFTPLAKPVNSHIRKRPPTKSPQVLGFPPPKKINLIGSSSPGLVQESINRGITNDSNGNETSLVKGVNVCPEKKTSPDSKSNVPWIKTEPAESMNDTNMNGEHDDIENKMDSPDGQDTTSHETNSEKVQIKNRRKNLIPLANIFKKFGNNAVKPEPESTAIEKPNSIVKNVFENSPVFNVNDLFTVNFETPETPEKIPISLPSNLGENLATDDYAASSENLVLSGYYDSDVYPHYRHRQKHLLNRSDKKPSKEKPKEKNFSGSPNGPLSQLLGTADNAAMKMYESGGRLVYSCDVCKRELSHLTSYRRHMKLHTMERPHVCPICSKGFIRKYHCIDHLNKHHKGVRFDPESLKLIDYHGPYTEMDEQQTYSPGDLSTSEYNYTLDQSLAGSEAELSINDGVDQSASSMLSELAKSAARLNQSDDAKEIDHHTGLLSGSLSESKENLNQSDEARSDISQSDLSSKEDERKPESANKKSMPTSLAKIVAELRSAPKAKHRKEPEQKSLSDQEEIPTQLLKYADEENWMCSKCPRGFISKEIYDEHLVSEHAQQRAENMDI